MNIKDKIWLILDKISIFGAINNDILEVIISHCDKKFYKKGDIIFEEDTPADNIFIIVSGRVKQVANYKTNPLELLEQMPGSTFGETAFIGIIPHFFTTIASEDTEVLIISRKILSTIHEKEPEVFTILIMNIARELARRLRKTKDIINDIAN